VAVGITAHAGCAFAAKQDGQLRRDGISRRGIMDETLQISMFAASGS